MNLKTIDAEDFDDLADQLMNKHYLAIYNDQEWIYYRICEIEFYLTTENHPDPYTHQDPQQLTCEEWYFHKAKVGGENYKSGTFKGLDITFGENVYGGILIRSIKHIHDAIIEGPCNIVNHILGITNSTVIFDLVQKMSTLNVFTNNYLKIISTDELTNEEIYFSRRVGLNSVKDFGFCIAPYRFMIYPYLIKKYRAGFKASLQNSGYSESEIKKILSNN
jgi:hypothetical protein